MGTQTRTPTDTFAAVTACFSTDLAALIGEEAPRSITPTGFVDLVERAMHVLDRANVDSRRRAGEELEHAIGWLTDALTTTGSDQRDQLARARTHLRSALETTR
ncbi:hypothetical protein [Streptomyces melanogenes]|uniref:hypothetical protein n=1 Tax=Streptomyces melanogenes TaxID=67326 RepID=UPI003798AB36